MDNQYDYLCFEFQPHLKYNQLTVKGFLENCEKLTGLARDDLFWAAKNDEKEALAKNVLVMAYWPALVTREDVSPNRGKWFASASPITLMNLIVKLRAEEQEQQLALMMQKRKI